MHDIVSRFWGFEKLLGTFLVKLIYYVGLFVGPLVILIGMVASTMTGYAEPLAIVGAIVLAPIIAVLFIVYWRFICELFILAFQTYERLGEIRDRLGPPPQPQYPGGYQQPNYPPPGGARF
jgi:hypothetical protein